MEVVDQEKGSLEVLQQQWKKLWKNENKQLEKMMGHKRKRIGGARHVSARGVAPGCWKDMTCQMSGRIAICAMQMQESVAVTALLAAAMIVHMTFIVNVKVVLTQRSGLGDYGL